MLLSLNVGSISSIPLLLILTAFTLSCKFFFNCSLQWEKDCIYNWILASSLSFLLSLVEIESLLYCIFLIFNKLNNLLIIFSTFILLLNS